MSAEKRSFFYWIKQKELWRIVLISSGLLGLAIVFFFPNSLETPAKHLNKYMSCAPENPRECAKLGTYEVSSNGPTAKAFQYLKIGCIHGEDDVTTCIRLAEVVVRGEFSDAEKNEVVDKLYSQCNEHVYPVCAYFPKITSDKKKLKHSIGVLKQFCRESPENCNLLADFYLNANDQTNFLKTGAKLCKLRHSYCPSYFASIRYRVDKKRSGQVLSNYCAADRKKYAEACR